MCEISRERTPLSSDISTYHFLDYLNGNRKKTQPSEQDPSLKDTAMLREKGRERGKGRSIRGGCRPSAITFVRHLESVSPSGKPMVIL